MYRPGMVPAPMPETGGRECGSPGPVGHAAQSQRSRAAGAGPPARGPDPCAGPVAPGPCLV